MEVTKKEECGENKEIKRPEIDSGIIEELMKCLWAALRLDGSLRDPGRVAHATLRTSAGGRTNASFGLWKGRSTRAGRRAAGKLSQRGAAAEYCLTTPAEIAPKPTSIDHLQAAAVPISGLTAWQALFELERADQAYFSVKKRALPGKMVLRVSTSSMAEAGNSSFQNRRTSRTAN